MQTRPRLLRTDNDSFFLNRTECFVLNMWESGKEKVWVHQTEKIVFNHISIFLRSWELLLLLSWGKTVTRTNQRTLANWPQSTKHKLLYMHRVPWLMCFQVTLLCWVPLERSFQSGFINYTQSVLSLVPPLQQPGWVILTHSTITLNQYTRSCASFRSVSLIKDPMRQMPECPLLPWIYVFPVKTIR